jgi:hypothetical protein
MPKCVACGVTCGGRNEPDCVRVPYATKRSNYVDQDGGRVPVDRVLAWRNKIFASLQMVGDDKDHRLCTRHFAGPDGVLAEGRIADGRLVWLPGPDWNLPRPKNAVDQVAPALPSRNRRLKEAIATARAGDGTMSQGDLQLVDDMITKLESLEIDNARLEKEVERLLAEARKSDTELTELRKEIAVLRGSSAYIRFDHLPSNSKSKNEDVYRLTGLRGKAVVKGLYDLVQAYSKGNADHFHQYDSRARVKNVSKRYRKDNTALDGMNQLFLTLFLLRTGTHLSVAGSLFGIDSDTVTRYFVTWLSVLSSVLKRAMPFPSQEATRASVPVEWIEAFGEAGKRVRIVLDATNISLPTPSDPDVQSATYSSYYSANCAKILVGITPSGAITFISLPYPGKISDTDLTELTILELQLLDDGDDVCADKGFTIHHLTYALGIGMVMPPKKQRGVSGFTEEQCELTSKIANKRIHVERAMKRLKAFSYLTRVIPATQFDLLGHIVFVVGMLSNFQPALKDMASFPDAGEVKLDDDELDLTQQKGPSAKGARKTPSPRKRAKKRAGPSDVVSPEKTPKRVLDLGKAPAHGKDAKEDVMSD